MLGRLRVSSTWWMVVKQYMIFNVMYLNGDHGKRPNYSQLWFLHSCSLSSTYPYDSPCKNATSTFAFYRNSLQASFDIHFHQKLRLSIAGTFPALKLLICNWCENTFFYHGKVTISYNYRCYTSLLYPLWARIWQYTFR